MSTPVATTSIPTTSPSTPVPSPPSTSPMAPASTAASMTSPPVGVQPMCFFPFQPTACPAAPAPKTCGTMPKKGQPIPICITVPPAPIDLPDCIPLKCLCIEIEGIQYCLDSNQEVRLVPAPPSCDAGVTASTPDLNDVSSTFTPSSCAKTQGVTFTASDGTSWTYDGTKYVSSSGVAPTTNPTPQSMLDCTGATFDTADPNTTGAVFTPPDCAKTPGSVLTGSDGSTWIWDSAGNLYNTSMFRKSRQPQLTSRRLPTQSSNPIYSPIPNMSKNLKTATNQASGGTASTRSLSGQRWKSSPSTTRSCSQTSPVYRFQY